MAGDNDLPRHGLSRLADDGRATHAVVAALRLAGNLSHGADMAHTDEPEAEDQPELETERPLILGDGDCCLVDTDYLDPRLQAEGVIMVSHSIDRGTWFLYGEVLEGGEYVRTWKNAEIKLPDKPVKPNRNLRSVT